MLATTANLTRGGATRGRPGLSAQKVTKLLKARADLSKEAKKQHEDTYKMTKKPARAPHVNNMQTSGTFRRKQRISRCRAAQLYPRGHLFPPKTGPSGPSVEPPCHCPAPTSTPPSPGPCPEIGKKTENGPSIPIIPIIPMVL